MKALLLAAAFLSSLCWAGTNPYNIIPEPVKVTTASGTTKNLKILNEQKVSGLGNEGYSMKLTPGGVELRYTTPNGKAMAMATLFQLQDQLADSPEGLPCGSIQDAPDFGWRGMMVDVGRYHYPMKELYNFVDAMHYYKYNVLHLHLTEDQGWRLPVPGYDKLRTIGSVRPSAPEGQNNSLLANEGMYSKKELQDLVAYCKARGIQVLPEVEMPGHNMALAASYPEFCCNTKRAQLWTHGGVSTYPSVIYEVTKTNGEEISVDNPSLLPEQQEIQEIREPIVKVFVMLPGEYIGDIMQLVLEKRGSVTNTETIDDTRVMLTCTVPLAEILVDFNDKLKSMTRGYGSMDYEYAGYQAAKLIKMDMLIAGEPVDAFSMIVHQDKAASRGRELAERLKNVIPRQLFTVAIQACIGGKIIARESISPMRKDVTAKCYGGDVTRKRKLLEKQKEGKKRMKAIGKINIPQEAFIKVLKTGN